MKKINKMAWGRYVFALAVVSLGVVFVCENVGSEFFGFGSVGNWLIYVWFVMLAVISLQMIINKKRIVDERMMAMAFEASRITFVFVIFSAFVVIVLDGVKSIAIPYRLFMS